jgi:hypothetical protein
MAGLFLLAATPAQTGGRLASTHSVPQEAAAPEVDFGAAAPAPDARRLADWIARTRDNQGGAFFLIDKVHATLYLFDRNARLQASTPVLLGAAIGDASVPGIGVRPMAQILPSERTTPAGRFVAEVGRNLQGEDVVWIDHGAAVSMHRVRTGNPHERRAERLGTATVDDNRISYGCINVPVAFYDQYVQAVFAASRTAVVYVLPETRSLEDQFELHLLTARVGGHSP